MARLATHDDDTRSVYSDLTSLLESDTDEFGRKLYQHTKDAQRIHAINGSTQAFRKARPNPRIALTLDNLQRNGLGPDGRSANDDALVRTAPSVTSSVDSDLPLNLPREWGRRGRHNNDWLKRMNQEEQHEKSPNIDWAAAADQSVEPADPEASPSRMPSRQTSTPPSAHQQDNSLDRIGEWDADQDLTAASLLTSTPALRPRPRQAIDEIRRREIDGVDKAAVTSSRRQIWERSTTRNVSPSASRPVSRRRSLMSNKENIPAPSTKQDRSPSHLLSKSVESVGTVDQAIQATVPRNPQRPQNQRRTDSMALLKRLARVSSNSPSPTSVKQAHEAERTNQSAGPPVNADTTAQRAVEETPVPVRQHTAPQTASEPEPPSREESQHRARADQTRLQTQTPVVTGAWVSTPRTERRPDTTSSEMNTQIPKAFTEETIVPRRRSEPTLPTSALAAVLEDMKRHEHHGDNDPTLGDSTIASLENLMDPSIIDPTVTLNIPDAVLQDQDNMDIRPTTQQDRNQRQEELALEALSRRLNSTRTSIHQANEGLRNIEHQDLPTAPSTTTARAARAERKTRKHQCDGHCSTCGRHASVFRSAWSEYWSLYFHWDDAAKWGWRLTWFGLACVAFWTWLATETTLCSMYCHPRYATHMRGYGVDPNAPRFPYVIPTLFFRPLKPLWQPLLALSAWSFGLVYDFVFSPDQTTSTGRVTAATGSSKPWFWKSATGGGGGGSKVSWFKSRKVGQGWTQQGKVERMNVWDRGQRAWEASGDGEEEEKEEEEKVRDWGQADSMLDDDYV